MKKFFKKLLSKKLKKINQDIKKLDKKESFDISPEELHFEITYACNSRCIMCDIWGKYHGNPETIREEMTFGEIKNFVDKSKYLKGLKLVLFSGGEPFLREDIVDICGYFVRKFPSISVGILSNCFNTGLTLDKIREIMDRCSPKNFWIGSSLDGLNEKHEEVRGVRGSFKTLVETTDLVKKEFPNIKISLNFTLTARNYRELLPSFNFAKDRGFGFSAQFAVPWEGVEKFTYDKAQLLEIRKQTEIIMEEILRSYHINGIFDYLTHHINSELLANLYYWNGLVAYQENPQRFLRYCVAGKRFAMFSPFGDLYFCPLLKYSIVGNIKQDDFDNLWVSAEAQKVRSSINKGSCHCWLNCTVYPNVVEALNTGT